MIGAKKIKLDNGHWCVSYNNRGIVVYDEASADDLMRWLDFLFVDRLSHTHKTMHVEWFYKFTEPGECVKQEAFAGALP